MLPYLDMKVFSFYNVMDVIVQKCIEKSTQDCEYIFTKCLVNNTVYPKGHRQSIYLANRFAKDLRTSISEKINKLPLRYYDLHSKGDILSHVRNKIKSLLRW